MNFYTITIIITVVILLGLLTWIGITMTGAKKQQTFPLTQNLCPDGWSSNGNTFCTQPRSTISPNRVSDSINSTVTDILNYPGGVCGAQRWATQNKISWDGVSNYNGQCN
jgi:hypothetical protein